MPSTPTSADPPGYKTWLRSVGRCIATRRTQLGWTQAKAAGACGMDFKQYQDAEYGRRPLSTRTLYRVAVGLETTVALLIADSTDVDPGETEPGDDPNDS